MSGRRPSPPEGRGRGGIVAIAGIYGPMTWKLSAAGLVASAGLYFLNHRIGGAVLLVTLVGVFIAAVFGDTGSTR